jgi:hypothetical protein
MALGLGKHRGKLIGFNVVQGFIGEGECAAWYDDELIPLGEGAIDADLRRVQDPWRVRTACGTLDATFEPRAIYRDNTNLGIIRSQFLQPVGAFSGAIRIGERDVSFDELAGVVEHQDVLW